MIEQHPIMHAARQRRAEALAGCVTPPIRLLWAMWRTVTAAGVKTRPEDARRTVAEILAAHWQFGSQEDVVRKEDQA